MDRRSPWWRALQAAAVQHVLPRFIRISQHQSALKVIARDFQAGLSRRRHAGGRPGGARSASFLLHGRPEERRGAAFISYCCPAPSFRFALVHRAIGIVVVAPGKSKKSIFDVLRACWQRLEPVVHEELRRRRPLVGYGREQFAQNGAYTLAVVDAVFLKRKQSLGETTLRVRRRMAER